MRIYNRALDAAEILRIYEGTEAARFRRGDSNDDGARDITDAIFTFNYLFLGGRVPGCRTYLAKTVFPLTSNLKALALLG